MRRLLMIFLLFAFLVPASVSAQSGETQAKRQGVAASIAGGVMVGGLVVGLAGTTVGTWRARNTILRFHLSLEKDR